MLHHINAINKNCGLMTNRLTF